MEINFAQIPEPLKDASQWVCWREEFRDGKLTKVPVNPRTGGKADCSKSDTWSTFLTSEAYYLHNRDNGARIKGIGFQVTESDPFVGIDLDKCRNPETGELESWAGAIIERLSSYTEVSPSGTGIRIFIKGKLPGPGNRKGKIEIYESCRYLTVTGHHLPGTPETIEDRQSELAALHQELFPPQAKQQAGPRSAGSVSLDHQEIITRAGAAANGGKFINLWAGDWSGYSSQSEGDLALVAILTFWTQDPSTLDRLFRASGLYREKWDKKHFSDGRTYGQAVIEKALAGIRETYQGPKIKVKTKEPPKAEPEQTDDPLIFPSEIMGGLAGDFARLYSESLEVPEHFFYISFLTCLGAFLADRVTLATELRTQPRLYTLLLGEAADDRKSTAISKTVGFFKYAIENFPACWGVGSAEGLAKRFDDNRNILLCLDELKLFVSKAKAETSVLLPVVTSLFENNLYHSRTKNNAINFDDAYLSLLAASTITTYEQVLDQSFLAIGFPSRLFLVPGRGEKKYSFPVKVPDDEKAQLKKRLGEILVYTRNPLELDLTPSAKEIFHSWYLNQERSVHSKRLDGYGLRFMLLMAINEMKHEVDSTIVERVLKLMDWQLKARRLHDPIDADNQIARLEEKIRRLLGTGQFSERDIKKRLHVERVGLYSYSAAMQNLNKAKEIQWEKQTKKWALS